MLPILIAGGLFLIALVFFLVFVNHNIVRVPPDQAAVLSGRRVVQVDPVTGERLTQGYRVISGGSAFRIPLIERIDRLPLNEMTIALESDDLRDERGRIGSLSLLVNCRISSEQPLIDTAIKRFLTMSLPDIEAIVKTTIESRVVGHLLDTNFDNVDRWHEIEARLVRSIGADLAALGVRVDNVIFRRVPMTISAIPAANGRGKV